MPLKNRLLLFAWLFYFCSLPLFKAFANVAEVALVILSFWPGTFSGLKHSVLRYKNVAALTLISGILILGMLYTEDLQNGWKILKHQHRFLIIPLLFLLHARLLQENFRKLNLAYILATGTACAFIVLLYLLPEETARSIANATKLTLPYPDNIHRAAFGLYSPFIDRLQFSSLTAVAVLSSLYLIVVNYKRKVLLAALPLLLFTMLILGGRGAQLALFISLLVYAVAIAVNILYPKLRKRTGKMAAATMLVLVGILFFAGIPYVSFKTLKPVQERFYQTKWEMDLLENQEYKQYDYEHFTTLRRLVSYKNMWQVVQQNPVLGTGTGDFHPELRKAYSANNPEMELNTHNQYLLFWGMTGIFGLLVFLAVLGFWLLNLRGRGQLYFYGLAFLVFYLVNMLPDTVLATQVDSMLFCTFMAFIGLQKYDQDAQPIQSV
ncbi:O-antigen ligase family protein [Adhaeribacter sp. BT258]|uniref:O-antigen ligase family protein n=1 Tax=Adhaeribacter terrigena TaxID=2793070 RepID=A0ABS1BWW4_9BACT|nr:O-antigen ligase family protein [Adhaeribacter terrigena]MBK0401376.1 O-antigen ligase family protein [Adhaeribacter terrigena]